MNQFGLPERTIKELLQYFCSNSNIEKVVIFGSRAKNTYRTGSDIDFAIWTKNIDTFHRISSDLDDLPTPYKFDVIDYKSLSHEDMKKSIDNDGIIFYQK